MVLPAPLNLSDTELMAKAAELQQAYDDNEAAARAAKRSAGRKRRQEATAATSKEAAQSDQAAQVPKEKRARGRPKGSKNKPKLN